MLQHDSDDDEYNSADEGSSSGGSSGGDNDNEDVVNHSRGRAIAPAGGGKRRKSNVPPLFFLLCQPPPTQPRPPQAPRTLREQLEDVRNIAAHEDDMSDEDDAIAGKRRRRSRDQLEVELPTADKIPLALAKRLARGRVFHQVKYLEKDEASLAAVFKYPPPLYHSPPTPPTSATGPCWSLTQSPMSTSPHFGAAIGRLFGRLSG